MGQGLKDRIQYNIVDAKRAVKHRRPCLSLLLGVYDGLNLPWSINGPAVDKITPRPDPAAASVYCGYNYVHTGVYNMP